MAEKFIVAKSIAEATSLKNDKSVFLAGGTEINRLNSSVKADTLVDLSKLKINGIELLKCDNSTDSFVKIGAMCTFNEILKDSSVPEYLKTACSYMSSLQRRNMATIGGNIASARDDSYLIATLLACGAELEIRCCGNKTRFADLCEYLSDKELQCGLIVSVICPVDCPVVTKRYANTASSHAMMTVSASLNEGITYVAAVVKGCGVFCFTAEDIPAIRFKDDIYGSKAYKRYILGVTVKDLDAQLRGGAV